MYVDKNSRRLRLIVDVKREEKTQDKRFCVCTINIEVYNCLAIIVDCLVYLLKLEYV